MQPIRQFAFFPRLALAAAIATGAVAGCDDSVSPRKLSGVFVLENVDGSPLPAYYGSYTVSDNSPATKTVYADTLTLHDDGTGVFGGTLLRHSILRNGEYEHDFHYFNRRGLTYVIEDDVITMTADPPVFSLFQGAGNSGSRLIIPPDWPLYSSYLIIRYRGTMTDAGLAVDLVNDFDFTFLPRRLFKRIQ